MAEPHLRTSAPLIVHVFPSFAVGGAQMRFAAIANRFGRAFRHIVVSLDGNWDCRARLDPELDATFPEIVAPKGQMLANARRFRAMLREWRPDTLVTGNWGSIEFAMANFPRIARHIHVVDGFGPEERATQLTRRVWMLRLVLARSPVVLPSRNLVRIATDIWKLPTRNVIYVPNGIDLDRFAAPSRTDRTLPPVIGTVAGLRPEKNVGRLISAFASIADRTPARLVVVGDGEERQALEQLAANRGIADRVTFTGNRTDTPDLYRDFDVFALSSDTEQMPLSVIEAMASGLPVAATDVGDVRAMLAADNDNFVVPIDQDKLAEALLTLLNDAPARNRIGAANLQKSRQTFHQEAMFQRYRALWLGQSLEPAA